eukprot:9329010-Karenia_brevis.AAC.1
MTGDTLVDADCWQFAYKAHMQVTDLVLLLVLICQACTSYRLPLILGVADLPKAFDMISHSFVYTVLMARKVPEVAVAWFMREITSMMLELKFRGINFDSKIHVKNGISQGAKWGPVLFKACLSWCVEPVWQSCQRDKLGYMAGTCYICLLYTSPSPRDTERS